MVKYTNMLFDNVYITWGEQGDREVERRGIAKNEDGKK